MQWNDISSLQIPQELEEFKKIRHLLPPCFFNVWVIVKGKENKIKAYWDAPNKTWYKATKNAWTDPILDNVEKWAPMKMGYEKQLKITTSTHIFTSI